LCDSWAQLDDNFGPIKIAYPTPSPPPPPPPPPAVGADASAAGGKKHAKKTKRTKSGDALAAAAATAAPPPAPAPAPASSSAGPGPGATTAAGGRIPVKKMPSASSGFGRRASLAASRSGDLFDMVSSRISRRASLTHASAAAVIGDGLDDDDEERASVAHNNDQHESADSSPVENIAPLQQNRRSRSNSSSSTVPNEKENDDHDDDEYDDSALQSILKEIPNVSRSSNQLDTEQQQLPVPTPSLRQTSSGGKATRRGSAFGGMGMGSSFKATTGSGGGSKKEQQEEFFAAAAAATTTTTTTTTEALAAASVGPVEYCVSESKPVVWIKSDDENNNEPSYLELNIFLRPKRIKREGHRSHWFGRSKSSESKRAVGVC
jgi:hypothetical protein